MPNRRTRRRITVAVLASVAVAAAVALTLGPPTVDAQALVIAQGLDMSPTALPRYAEEVFSGGQVAESVADVLGVDAGDVVPNRVSLTAKPGSMGLTVTGHADDDATATLIANTAAAAYVAALNRAWGGVGQFELIGPARPSDPPPAWATVSASTLGKLPVAITVVLALGVLLLFTRLGRTSRRTKATG